MEIKFNPFFRATFSVELKAGIDIQNLPAMLHERMIIVVKSVLKEDDKKKG